MKKTIIFLTLLSVPYLFMIIVNESINPKTENQSRVVYGYKTMNSSKRLKEKCTWACHNDTSYCKTNHVKTLKPYYEYTDPIYFGIINLLHSTGNYGLANILFLVILIPFMICYFTTQSISLIIKTKAIKNKK